MPCSPLLLRLARRDLEQQLIADGRPVNSTGGCAGHTAGITLLIPALPSDSVHMGKGAAAGCVAIGHADDSLAGSWYLGTKRTEQKMMVLNKQSYTHSQGLHFPSEKHPHFHPGKTRRKLGGSTPVFCHFSNSLYKNTALLRASPPPGAEFAQTVSVLVGTFFPKSMTTHRKKEGREKSTLP